YTSKVVGHGLDAQKQNPEVKVHGMDHTLAEIKKSLEHFNQETQEKFPELGEIEIWEELGSGEEQGSTTDCDDEDGCQSSGDGEEHDYVVNGQTSNGRQPEGGNTQDDPSKPPAVRVVGGTPPMSLQQPWCLALIFAGLCLKSMLF
ncbi:glypican-5-like, partial [Cyprinodon tularosa]|uniref:glypican-5-like n=1 Tax=Cyprinodon tularosa TaxID=77115 RepID=UPI0018E202D8